MEAVRLFYFIERGYLLAELVVGGGVEPGHGTTKRLVAESWTALVTPKVCLVQGPRPKFGQYLTMFDYKLKFGQIINYRFV